MQGRRSLSARVLLAVALVTGVAYGPESSALRFDLDDLGGVSGTLNTNLSLGVQWRLQERDPALIGKANLDPDLCPSACQPHASTTAGDIEGRVQLGLEAEGNAVNQVGLDAPGAASVNNDDGNLNFDRFDATQAPIQITQDLELDFGDVGFVTDVTFFGRYNAFHDFVNYGRKIYHPNFYTPRIAHAMMPVATRTRGPRACTRTSAAHPPTDSPRSARRASRRRTTAMTSCSARTWTSWISTSPAISRSRSWRAGPS